MFINPPTLCFSLLKWPYFDFCSYVLKPIMLFFGLTHRILYIFFMGNMSHTACWVQRSVLLQVQEIAEFAGFSSYYSLHFHVKVAECHLLFLLDVEAYCKISSYFVLGITNSITWGRGHSVLSTYNSARQICFLFSPRFMSIRNKIW